MTWTEKTGLTSKQITAIILSVVTLIGGLGLSYVNPRAVEYWFQSQTEIQRDLITEEIEAYIDQGLGGSPYQTEKTCSYLVGQVDVGGTVYNYALNGTTGKLEFRGTDAATVIQAAMDAGDNILIKVGNYSISAQLEPNNNTVLCGEGRQTVLRAANGLGAANVIQVNTKEANILIKNLCIDGNLANRVDGGNDWQQCNIYVLGGNVTIDSCYLMNSTRHNVYFGYSNSKGGIMSNCYTGGSGDHGLYVRNGASEIKIVDNVFKNCGRAGIRFGPNTEYCIADGNLVDGAGVLSNDPGLHSYDNGDSSTPSRYHIFSNNIVINGQQAGIKDENSDTKCHNSYIGNTVIGSTGIVVEDNVLLQGNVVIDTNSGIWVKGDHNMVIGNRVNETTAAFQTCILVDGNENTIIGNWCNDAKTKGIRINGDHNIVKANVIPEAGQDGIYLTGDYNLIEGNTISVTGSYGVNDEGDNNRILYNDLIGCDTATRLIGTNVVVMGNIGFVTENAGNATLAAVTSSIAVNHGCDYTPTLGDIQVTPSRDLGNCTYYWIDTIGAAQFTIHVGAAGAAKNIDKTVYFLWSVRRH